MTIDWLSKLRNFLQTMAFCLAIAAIQYAFKRGQPYEVLLIYSICIGTSCWASIDFGRHLYASSAETGWPQGRAGLLLPFSGTASGFVIGTLLGDWWFGWSSWGAAVKSQLPLSILITALAGLAASYYFYSRNRSGYLETKMAEASRHATEAKLKLLQTQLEPHMLFNSLANLRALISTDAPRAQDMLDHMIAYLRATLNASRASCHTLQAEFDRLRDYLELMSVRMGPRLTYQLELPPALASHAVPTLLLQPLVENAINHGLEPKVEGGGITVRASRNGSHLVLNVIDTGAGIPVGHDSADGFGLAQVRERLATAYGIHGHLIISANGAAGTRAIIALPYEISDPT